MNQSLLLVVVFFGFLAAFASGSLCDQFPEFEGCSQLAEMQKRKSAYMRFGRSSPDFDDGAMAMEKRKSAYMRFGKRSSGAEEAVPLDMGADVDDGAAMEKRKSAYMRFGKRKSAYMRFGKRSAGTSDSMPLDLVPVDAESSYEMQKRKPASLRFG